MGEVILPNNWQGRAYQIPAWRYLRNGGKRAVLVWHRRSGKDEVALHWTAVASQLRVGNYWHMLPKASQARKAIWEAINPHSGLRRIDEAFPVGLRDTTRDTDMLIRFKNGSTWQVVGSDNYNALVGTPPIGLVISEWSLAKPEAWTYLAPILRENGGWAVFPYTPRGKNHGYALYELARMNPETWFAERLTVDDTKLFSRETLEAERDEMSRLAEHDAGQKGSFEQEYYCSWEGSATGAYYGDQFKQIDADKRITKVPHQPEFPVDTWWDIGIGDQTAVWFVQYAGNEVHLIDYYENSGEGITHYAKMLRDRPYIYGEHIAPHDIEAREFLTGNKTRKEVAKGLGIDFRTVPRHNVGDGIEASRNMLARCWFDEQKCRLGIEALRQYHKEWNEKNRTYHDNPAHDWASHGADAFRQGAMAGRKSAIKRKIEYPKLGVV